MKATKTLMATSIIAAAGAAGGANAATVATFSTGSVSASIILGIDMVTTDPYDPLTYVEIVAASSGTASAVLDDAGTFTITSTVSDLETIVGTNNTMSMIEVLHGTWSGTTFTATSGTHEYTNCIDNPPVVVPGCAALASAIGPQPAVVTGSITLAGGLASVSTTDLNSGAVIKYTYSFGVVPIPATAWLFGSGLIGIAGVRKRKIK